MKRKANPSRRSRIEDQEPDTTCFVIDTPPKTPRERRQQELDSAALRLALRIMQTRPTNPAAQLHAAD